MKRLLLLAACLLLCGGDVQAETQTFGQIKLANTDISYDTVSTVWDFSLLLVNTDSATALNVTQADNDAIFVVDTNTPLVMVGTGAAANLLIGHTASDDAGAFGSLLQVHALSSDTAAASVVRWGSGDAPARFTLGRSYGAAVGTNGICVTGEAIGSLDFAGDDGVDLLPNGTVSARILVEASGTVGADRVPTEMSFWTTTNAAPGVLTKAMTIDDSGDLVLSGDTNVYTDGASAVRMVLSGTDRYISVTGNDVSARTYVTFGFQGGVVHGFFLQAGGVVAWTSSTTQSAGQVIRDTGISRLSPGVVAIGNGAAADVSGTLAIANVLIGHTASDAGGAISSLLQVHGSDDTNPTVGLACVNWDAADVPPMISTTKSGGAAPGTNGVVTTAHSLGRWSFYGDDGTDLEHESARIEAIATGTIGTNRIPSYMTCSVSTDAAPSVLTEIWRATATGFGTNGTTLGFYGTTPTTQPAHLADPTDLATCITAITQIIDDLKSVGLMAADP